MDSSSIYPEFAKLASCYRVKKLAEDSRKDGVVIDILVNDLRVNCNWNYMDLTVAVTTAIEANSWTPGWAAVYYLFAYFQEVNDPDTSEAILNSSRQITWLVENFDKVYSLMCDPDQNAKKSLFFEFQQEKFRKRSEGAVGSFKKS